jgi:hypothetical protein
MRTVWKYSLNIEDYETEKAFQIPRGGIVRHVAAEGMPGLRLVSFWVEVETDHDRDERKFVLIGTGHPIREDRVLQYHGTAIFPPALVLHVYEELQR